MKTKISFIAILLLMAILLGSVQALPNCRKTQNLPFQMAQPKHRRKIMPIRLNLFVQAVKNGFPTVLQHLRVENKLKI